MKQEKIRFHARFIEAMLALAVKDLPGGSEWSYELKLDGYRALDALPVPCLRLLRYADAKDLEVVSRLTQPIGFEQRK